MDEEREEIADEADETPATVELAATAVEVTAGEVEVATAVVARAAVVGLFALQARASTAAASRGTIMNSEKRIVICMMERCSQRM